MLLALWRRQEVWSVNKIRFRLVSDYCVIFSMVKSWLQALKPKYLFSIGWKIDLYENQPLGRFAPISLSFPWSLLKSYKYIGFFPVNRRRNCFQLRKHVWTFRLLLSVAFFLHQAFTLSAFSPLSLSHTHTHTHTHRLICK